MSRLDLLTVLIVGICLTALGVLLYKTFQLMQQPGGDIVVTDPVMDPSPNPDTNIYYYDTVATDVLTPEPADITAVDDDRLAVDDPQTELTEPASSPAASSPSNYDATPSTTTPRTTTPAATTTTTPKSAPAAPTTAEPSGRYAVVAGSFGQRSNADDQIKKLKRLGYSDAEVVYINKALASAVVGRYGSRSAADRIVKELKGRGIDALIKTM